MATVESFIHPQVGGCVMSQSDKLFLADFVYLKPLDRYLHVPTRRVYTADEIDRIFPPVPVLTDEADEGSRHG
jgi:hypothetical protein